MGTALGTYAATTRIPGRPTAAHGMCAARPRAGLGHAGVAPPATRMGRPGKPHPGGPKGSSDIASGRGRGCMHVHGAQVGGASAVRLGLPLPPRWGIPASPTPGVPKDRAALQTGGGWDARPVGMVLGTCAEGTLIPCQPNAAHARARQTGARMVRQRAGKLGAGSAHCGGAAQNVRR
ncbi:hypothetical protein COCNU_scaffold006362G000090 [Cocos nucifera]|nr:hypothetical protein [Cocos nucifera]